jgi:PAS domain S-box-containing protein
MQVAPRRCGNPAGSGSACFYEEELMSVVTTQPEMLASVPSTPNARLLDGNLPGHPCDGTLMDGSGRIERRRNGDSADSPMDILRRLPAVVVLGRLPVPALAMARDGIILFANMAFAEMVGYGQDGLAGSAFPEIFHTVPAALCALSGVDVRANLVVELRHCEGWTVRAGMSNSALMRRDDPVVLATFENLTEQLWVDERVLD